MFTRTEISTALETPLGTLRITTATEKHLPWIEHLQRRLHRMIGFVPTPAQRQRMGACDYWLLDLNGDDAGFLLLGAGLRKPVRLSQIAVHPDLWNGGIGTAAMSCVLTAAKRMPCPTVVADVASNLFQMQQMCTNTGALHDSTRLYVSTRQRKTLRFRWPSATDPLPGSSARQVRLGRP